MDFNSRPYARGDKGEPLERLNLKNFNSRPYARGDAGSRQPERLVHGISIHAPTRGATQMRKLGGTPPIFQFTPLREGRRKAHNGSDVLCQFQFTPLREGRHQKEQSNIPKVELFQFTPLREGRRGGLGGQHRCSRCISIHAPTRGATPILCGNI